MAENAGRTIFSMSKYSLRGLALGVWFKWKLNQIKLTEYSSLWLKTRENSRCNEIFLCDVTNEQQQQVQVTPSAKNGNKRTAVQHEIYSACRIEFAAWYFLILIELVFPFFFALLFCFIPFHVQTCIFYLVFCVEMPFGARCTRVFERRMQNSGGTAWVAFVLHVPLN